MAKIRSSARQAPRHSGDLYESGYQYRHPERDVVWLGPWKGMQPFGILGDPREYLLDSEALRIEDGSIRAAWSRTDTPVTGWVPLGAFNFPGLNSGKHLGFYLDAADNLVYINAIDASGPTIEATGLTYNSSIYAAAWGNSLVYFTDGASIHSYATGPLVSTVSPGVTNPGPIFELNNNLIVFGGVFVNDIFNSVDGDPEDFTGAGSGIHRFNHGQLFGGAKIGESVFALGTGGTEEITPTGIGSPAFSYKSIPEVIAGFGPDKVVGVNKILWYIDSRGAICVYDGASVRRPPILNTLIGQSIFYNSYIHRVIVQQVIGAFAKAYLINPDTYEIETRLDIDHLWYTAGAPDGAGSAQMMVAYSTSTWSYFDLAADADFSTNKPWFESDEFKFPGMVMIDEILLHRSGDIVPSLTLIGITREGGSVSYVLDEPVLDSRYCRYYLNAAVDAFQLILTDTITGSEWHYAEMIKRIGVHYTLMDREQTTTT